MDKKEKESLAGYIIDLAKKYGADEVAINLVEDASINMQYRDGEIEQLQESLQCGLSVQIYLAHKFSSHSTNDLRKESIDRFLENAINATKYLTPDKYRELPAPKFYPQNLDLDLKLVDPSYTTLNSLDGIDLIAKIHQSAREQSDKIISVVAGFSASRASSLKVHSNGFIGHKEATMFSAGAETTVKDNESRPEDWFYASSRYYGKLPSPRLIGEKAAQGALGKIGQSRIKSGSYPTIIENRASIRLISMLLSPMLASSIQQKSSFLDGMIGQAIASEKLSIFDKPFIEQGLGSRLFDGEGIASKDRIIVEKGILKQFFVDNYYGHKLGMEPNGGSSSNLIFENGKQSVEQLIKNIGKGILITAFNGGNSNPTTGDFSFGISGFLFDNGHLSKPINEMNITGNAKTFWSQLIEMGNDPYIYAANQVPSMVFEGISFSGL
jgi:PmbA protein